ncbi:MAG: glycerol transport system ATP-binding protein [Candidatus Azotimanducaceae bacterium]|jgi:glycerol transport system ATP-binding protein
MAEIVLENLGHSYMTNPNGANDFALKPVNLTWQDGKTYALLGPSGCGKTTMLNIISGLVPPSHGRLLFDGQDVTLTPTSKRNIAQVFQFPVIYSTKTVRQNLAFPLECRGVAPGQIKDRVAEIAMLLDLGYALDMPARKLSADQKQLISLGRGLVREDVSAILLDEPLTVIDPQMKFMLRRKLREINRQTGVTMILVTHDQSEAMSFADEIVVMKDGLLQQSGTPAELFSRPQNDFVGYFIGSPPMNMITLEAREGALGTDALKLTKRLPTGNDAALHQMGIRPEHISLVDNNAQNIGTGTIKKIEHLGVDGIVTLQLAAGVVIKAKTRKHTEMKVGKTMGVNVRKEDALLYIEGVLSIAQ